MMPLTKGKVRTIELAGVRHYVHKTNLRTYVVSTTALLTLESMVQINGEYHFNTLQELYKATVWRDHD